jgi:hypothetical protein
MSGQITDEAYRTAIAEIDSINGQHSGQDVGLIANDAECGVDDEGRDGPSGASGLDDRVPDIAAPDVPLRVTSDQEVTGRAAGRPDWVPNAKDAIEPDNAAARITDRDTPPSTLSAAATSDEIDGTTVASDRVGGSHVPEPDRAQPRDRRSRSATKPTSQRKVAANRVNARRSTGPQTAAGKARSALNALKSGANADPNRPLNWGPFGETPEAIASFKHSIVASFECTSPVLTRAAEALAAAMLSSDRLGRAEEVIVREAGLRALGRSVGATDADLAEELLADIVEALEWLCRVFELSERNGGSLAWKRVVAAALEPGQAEALVHLFDQQCQIRITVEPDRTGDREPTTEKQWRRVLRGYVDELFQGDPVELNEWLEERAHAVTSSLPGLRLAASVPATHREAEEARTVAQAIMSLAEVQARTDRRVAAKLRAYQDLLKIARTGDAVEDG